jgi:hypothetical protein
VEEEAEVVAREGRAKERKERKERKAEVWKV